MTPWTTGQQMTVAILPKIASFCTAFGSLWVMIEVLTHQGHHADISNNNSNNRRKQVPKRYHPYHRLLFMMSFYDFLEAIWNFMSTWPIPTESKNRIWASGNRGVCSTQGFFLQLAIAVPLYNAFLSLYYMLVINFQVTETTLVNKVEPVMHVVAGGVAFGTALSMVFMGYMNDANLWCWIAPYPQGCSAADSVTPCTRGEHYWIFRWSFYFAPLWFCILSATCCTVAVYWKVRQSDKRTLQYRKPESILSANFSRNSKAGIDNNRFEDSGSLHLSLDQRASTFQSSVECSSEYEIAKEFRDIADIEQRENEFLLNRREAFAEQGQPKQPSNPDASNRRSSRLSSISTKLKQWKEEKEVYQDQHKTSVEVFRQSLWYMGAFYLTHAWSTSNRIYQQLNNGKGLFPLTVIHSFFDPFQGMMNFIVYQRPRYLIVRKHFPELGRIGAIYKILHFSFMQGRFLVKKQRKEASSNKSPSGKKLNKTKKLSSMDEASDQLNSNEDTYKTRNLIRDEFESIIEKTRKSPEEPIHELENESISQFAPEASENQPEVEVPIVLSASFKENDRVDL